MNTNAKTLARGLIAGVALFLLTAATMANAEDEAPNVVDWQGNTGSFRNPCLYRPNLPECPPNSEVQVDKTRSTMVQDPGSPDPPVFQETPNDSDMEAQKVN